MMSDGFGKVFAQLYEGSMVGAGPLVFALWPYCLARADAKGVVEVNPRLACHVIGCSVQQIEEALEYLQRPDPESRSREEEGRRLIREGQFAYRIVNYQHYRELRDAEARREYQRRWDRENRPGRPERRESKPEESRQIPTNPDNPDPVPTIPTQAEAEAEAEEEERERGPSAPRPAKAGPSHEDVAQLATVWNLNRGILPGVSKIDPKGSRARHARARLAETPDLNRWEAAVRRLAASHFARGENDRGWRADFDFLLQPDCLAKIEEGKYDDRKPPSRHVPGPGAHNAKPAETPIPDAPKLPRPPDTPDGPENVLPRILDEVRPDVDDRDFSTWLAPLRQAGPVNGHFILVAPTDSAARIVRDDYLRLISDAAFDHGIDVPIRLFAEDGSEVETR